jgi:glycosyltransferase involved in cell wall biosynthesis
VILSPQLLGLQHSPSREAVNMALTLANSHGVDVYILNANTMAYTNDINVAAPALANANPEFKGAQRLQTRYGGFKDPTFKLISFEPGRLSLTKLEAIAATVLEIAPDAILAHGENHMVQDLFYGRIPSLFATTGQVLPFARADAYWAPGSLVSERHYEIAARFGHGRILKEAMFTTPSDVDCAPADRSAFALAPDQVIYLAAGGRLAQEIDPGFAAACVRILNADPRAVVLFAGPAQLDIAALFGAEAAAGGRLVNLGFRDDLPAITRMSDVYLNPSRTGGGTSAQTALFCGLPVATLAHGHVSDVMDPASRRSDWDDYVAYAARLAQDAAFRRAEAARQLTALRSRSESAAQVERLLGYLTEVRSAYLART